MGINQTPVKIIRFEKHKKSPENYLQMREMQQREEIKPETHIFMLTFSLYEKKFNDTKRNF